MEDEDAWLYGDEPSAEVSEEAVDKPIDTEIEENTIEETILEPLDNPENIEEAEPDMGIQITEENDDPGGLDEDGQDVVDDEDEDSDEDDIKITIDHKEIDDAKTSYQTLGLNKPVSMTGRAPGMMGGLSVAEKKGKFNVEEFDQLGLINGQPAQDVDLESIEDKPWKKPGADITDYFNYGFTEDTWQAYCSRQRRMRVNESGAGLPAGPGGSSHHYNRTSQINTSGLSNGKMSTNNVNSAPSSIPTLGSTTQPIRISTVGTRLQSVNVNSVGSPDMEAAESKQEPAPISVMTSDKRIYSKKVMDGIDPSGSGALTADFSLPPPGIPPPGIPPPNAMNLPPPGLPPSMNVPPPGLAHIPASGPPPNIPPSGDFDFSHNDENYEDYYGGYEPTQESQWQVPPTFQDRQGPPPNSDAPPGDAGYDEHKSDTDPWKDRRSSRETPPHRPDHYSDQRIPPDPRIDPRYDPRYESRPRSSEMRAAEYESSRKRRRSRSPSPRSRTDRYREHGGRDRESSRSERDRIDRERERDRDHRHSEQRDREVDRNKDRDKERGREEDRRSDRDRSDKRERERSERSSRSDRTKEKSKSRSKSPSSSHKHKKSKKDKREKSDKSDAKKEIKEEPA